MPKANGQTTDSEPSERNQNRGRSPSSRRGALARNIAKLREKSGLTQKSLADISGLTQSYISKLENSAEDDAPLAELGRLATGLSVPLVELLEGSELIRYLGESASRFHAFCPNPLCKSNSYYIDDEDGRASVHFASWSEYGVEDFENVNYCGDCGTQLIKQCESCKAFLQKATAHFCMRCGKQIHNHPTEEELDQIRQRLGSTTLPS